MAGAQVSVGDGNTVSFARKLAESPRFKSLFRDGMSLVEEVAAYLDGPGRDEAKALSRPVALAYAAESMRLTTRLMQAASWLLLQRAVNEGEMTQSQAETEKHRVKLSIQEVASGQSLFAQLPVTMQELTGRSLRLQARILHVDRSIRTTGDVVAPMSASRELNLQWERLKTAFRAGP